MVEGNQGLLDERVDAKQRTIDALLRVGKAMISSADWNTALGTMIEAVSAVFDAETGGFLLYDEDTDMLVLQEPAFGIDDPTAIAAYRVRMSDGGNAVRVFRSQQVYVSNAAPRDPRLLKHYVEMFGARNVLSAPLIVQGRSIGVFHAINKRSGLFTDDDVALIELIAPLLAVSITSAQLFRETVEHRRQLERAVHLQSQLSAAALSSGGLDGITKRLAELINRPVSVVDVDARVLAAAGWPDDIDPTDGDSTSLISSPVGRDSDAERGQVVVYTEGSSLDTIEQRAIDHAAGVFALELLRERTAYEVEARVKGAVLDDLFRQDLHDDEAAADVVARLGERISGPVRVVLAQPSGAALAAHRSSQLASRLYPRIQRAATTAFGRATVSPWRSGFVALVPARSPGEDRERAQLVHDEIVGNAGRIDRRLDFDVALSSPRPLTSLRTALREAERSMQIAQRLGDTGNPVLFDQLGVYRVLLGGDSPREQAAFVDEVLGPIAAYDLEHDAGLVETLRAWFMCDRSITDTATTIHVHRNTVKYRLARIRELLGFEPGTAAHRLDVELALRLIDLQAGTATTFNNRQVAHDRCTTSTAS